MLNINKIIIFFLYTFFLFSTLSLFSQNIECEEIVFSYGTHETSPDLEKREPVGDAKAGSLFKVKAILKIDSPSNDTITLRTAVKLSALGPTNFKVGLISPTGGFSYLPSWVEQHSGSEFLSDTQSLKFILSNTKSAIVSMEYNIIGSLLFRYEPENINFFSLQQQYESFYPIDMLIKEVRTILPDSLKSFLSYKKDEGGMIKDLNISLINMKCYQECLIQGNKYGVRIYIPDTLAYNASIRQKIDDLQKYMNRVSIYFSENRCSDIIYINWRDDKHRRAFGECLGSHIVCDVNFGSKDLLHEIIHSLLPIEVEKSSKGEYFIKESIIEWLALFLSETEFNNLEQIQEGSTSLYDIQTNNQYSWNKIYLFGPSIIEQIAMKYGRNKMAKIIISFLEKNNNKVVNYESFINYLNIYLPSDLVMELDSLLKAY